MENIWMFLQQTAAASLTALFLLVLQRVFLDKLSPRWQYGVWLVLLLRLLIPVGAGRTTVLDVSGPLELLRTQAELGLNSAYSSPFAAALPAVPVPLPPEGDPASWTDALFVLYWAGVIFSALWFLFCAGRLSRRAKGGVPVEGARRAQIQALAAEYRLPLPARIVECRWSATPFVLGVFRPVLVLPMGWAVDGKVILHELLHLKYRDIWAGWLTTLFRCLHWCNPFLWFVFDKIGSDRESLCDQRALERLSGEDRRDYGRALLAMADNRRVRTPGATTMANGAKAVKARIEAIARFRRFPQGMGLVSGCIVAALSLSLAAGVPAAALSEGRPVELPHGADTAQALSAAAQNRASTVAGALDAYGKSVYLRYNRPPESLLCTAMVTAPADMPAVLAGWEAFVDSMDMEEALYWYSAGPTFRGLSPDGAGGYLCQVFWFRDKEIPPSEVPEALSLYPVEYLCHTVRVRPDGRFWTVEKLAETAGDFDVGTGGTLFYWYENLLYGPVTWSGEANGVSVEISPGTTLLTGNEMLGENTLTAYRNGRVGTTTVSRFFGFSEEEPAGPAAPIPSAGFRNYDAAMRLEVQNGGTSAPIALRAIPVWDNPEIAPSRGLGNLPEELDRKGRWQSCGAFYYLDTLPALSPGEILTDALSGGGGSVDLGEPVECFVGPDGFSVTARIGDGEPFEIPMTARYTTPDGGTFSLDGEEDKP